jgi:hypothetical protein
MPSDTMATNASKDNGGTPRSRAVTNHTGRNGLAPLLRNQDRCVTNVAR